MKAYSKSIDTKFMAALGSYSESTISSQDSTKKWPALHFLMPPYCDGDRLVSAFILSKTKVSRVFENRVVQNRFLHVDRDSGLLPFGIMETVSSFQISGHT